jgi:preprotein translocase subunit SecG
MNILSSLSALLIIFFLISSILFWVSCSYISKVQKYNNSDQIYQLNSDPSVVYTKGYEINAIKIGVDSNNKSRDVILYKY